MSLLALVSKYAKSLAGGPPSAHTVRQSAQLILGAVFAGYTATAFPPKFLKMFEKPWAQFLVFLVLFNQSYWNETGFPRWYALLDALIFTVLLQTAIYFAKKAYPSEEESVEQEIVFENDLVEDDSNVPEVDVVPVENQEPSEQQNGFELVVVHASSWCGWSKKQMEEFPQIKGELERNGVSVREVEDNSQEGQQLAKQFRVDGFPASLVFKGRDLVNKIGGYRPASAMVKEVLSLKNNNNQPKPSNGGNKQGVELVVVHASSWCGWSKKQMEEYPSIKSALQQKNVAVREVEDSSEEGKQLARQFGIDGYPGSLVFKNGELVDKVGGYKPADAMVQQFSRHL